MIQRMLYLLISCLFIPCFVFAQAYSYTRYDIQHGLAGSTAYCVLQDRQGFLWFGTETGVSRFDGTNFKNFTTIDGLPDNQVIEIFEDSKGRIWMAPFSKSVCYYFKGKIYNRDNDSALNKIQLSGNVIQFAEDTNGDLYILQDARLTLLKQNGSLITFNATDAAFLAAGTGPHKFMYVIVGDKVYNIVNDKLVYKFSIKLSSPNYKYVSVREGVLAWRSDQATFQAMNSKTNTRLWYGSRVGPIKMSVINDSVVSINLQTGTIVQNVYKDSFDVFVPGEPVSNVFQDREGIFWFTTLGHGVFMLNSPYIFNLPLTDVRGSQLAAYSVLRYGDRWLAGSEMTSVYGVSDNESELLFRRKDSLPERVMDMYIANDRSVWIGTDSRISHLGTDMNWRTEIEGITVKDFLVRGNTMYVAASRGVYVLDMATTSVIDTLWRERTTSIFVQGDSVFIGTLNGLFIVTNDKITDVGKEIKQLRYRISAMDEDERGTLWIATFSGIYGFRNGRIIASITEHQGLVSNICRVLTVYKNELWVGTNRGLQKIDISNADNPVVSYSLARELASEIINYIYADSANVAVGTPEGVSILDKKHVSFNSRADLYIDAIIVSGNDIGWNGKSFFLPNKDNNIRFEFAGISYRSGGQMRYNYRLVGLDSAWKQSRENFLNYPTLPGGSYTLEIQAVDKFGQMSNMVSVDFTIDKRLWQKLWFQLVTAIIAGGLIWLLLAWRVKVIRRQENEKNNVRKKMAALEQLALKSQMNPHFIFNSLNSIQQYVLDKDVAGANKFITGFSRLIRQTLDISTRHEISLSEEMRYLSTYLELEKMRFEDKFVYEVVVDASLNPDDCFIPPMILQPFVENCVRHGIRYRKDDKGRISVSFKRSGTSLDCIIEDNGVGRKTAGIHKSANPIEYQSKGISLTSDRIALLNRNAGQPIRINIYDLENGTGVSEGTRVVLSFPLQPIEKL
jgi:ligand-binding sensor domain-containing protein